MVDRIVHDSLTDLQEHLAPCALHTPQSRGRRHAEPTHAYRSLYQRDRDRIVYSTAFRRLMHKTQVLVAQTNDHHRTRLTHTLEVAQIARTISRQLRLNEDLTEAIALSHDLGHPPFGHAGEKALDECMAEQGGFEHNLHALRLVEVLEEPYPDFPGLNLTWEVREAMAQHSPRKDHPEVQEYLSLGQPLLEAQVADAADSLAYVTHDADDALEAELITLEDLRDVTLCRDRLADIHRRCSALSDEHLRPMLIRAMVEVQVNDLLEHSRRRLRESRIESLDDVRHCPHLLVEPSEEMIARKKELATFLRERVYYTSRVERMGHKGANIVRALFTTFCKTPQLLPTRPHQRIAKENVSRVVCDYIASLTDRSAREEYLHLFSAESGGLVSL